MDTFVPGGPERMAHQKRGLKKLIRRKGVGALLYDPGLGKTAVALDYMSILALKKDDGEARVLVVAPLAAVDTWVYQAETFLSPEVNYWAEALGGTLKNRAEALKSRGPHSSPAASDRRRREAHRARHVHKSIDLSYRTDEGKRFSPSQGPDGLGGKPKVVIETVNLDTFSSRRAVGSRTMADVMLSAVKAFQPDLVVVDESHKIKSASSNVSRLMGRVGAVVPRRIILTGTVMPHSPMDVFGQWRFLDPFAFGQLNGDGERRRATFPQFRERFAVMGGYMGREYKGFKNLDELHEIMAVNAEVATKEASLDLPEATDTWLSVSLSDREKKAYRDMKTRLRTDFEDGTSATEMSRLTQMLRLRQITSGYLPNDNNEVVRLGGSKVKAILSLVADTLTSEKRIVIFSVFTQEIRDLVEGLSKDKQNEVMEITGNTSAQERMRMRKRFKSDDPQRMVMVAQISTMSLAVNELVAASHAIFGSLTQMRDELVQARDRLHRVGQKLPTTFWYAIARGTVDEVIMQAHSDRTDLESAILQHVHETGSESEI